MQTEYLIAVDVFCANHNIEVSFISSLKKTGLIDIKIIEENEFIEAEQLQQLEKYVRFFYDLDINLEGIESITHLLEKIKLLKEENRTLRNRLSFYETE